MKPLKVVFCIPNMVIGGIETVFVNTIDELSKSPEVILKIVTHTKIQEALYTDWLQQHPEISVYTYYPMGNWFESLKKYCTFFPIKQLRKLLFGAYKSYRRTIAGLKNIFFDADIVIDYKNFAFYKELKNVKKTKIAWTHTANSFFEKRGAFAKLHAYDKIIGITDDFVDTLKQDYPQYANRVLRVYNPLNFDLIREKSHAYASPKGKYFCHVSRLVPGKDIKTLLNAFELFAQTNNDTKLYIVGDGNMLDTFKAFAATLSVSDRIIFTGMQKNPYPIMSGAVANILSSEFEGLPTVLIESQVLGVPTISSDCKNGPHEILQNGKSGLLFNVGNAEQLSHCMFEAVEKKSKMMQITQTATKNLTRFDSKRIRKDIIQIFKTMR